MLCSWRAHYRALPYTVFYLPQKHPTEHLCGVFSKVRPPEFWWGRFLNHKWRHWIKWHQQRLLLDTPTAVCGRENQIKVCCTEPILHVRYWHNTFSHPPDCREHTAHIDLNNTAQTHWGQMIEVEHHAEPGDTFKCVNGLLANIDIGIEFEEDHLN